MACQKEHSEVRVTKWQPVEIVRCFFFAYGAREKISGAFMFEHNALIWEPVS